MKNIICLALMTLIINSVQASQLEGWITRQEQASWQKLLANLSPADTRPGAVVASPQRRDPDYFFHWVRDAALVMDILMAETRRESNPALNQHIQQYIDFSRYIQEQNTITGLGEAKYYVDGSAFNEPWGRPQNDSPALRALYLVRHTQYFLDQGIAPERLRHLYYAELPARSLIKRDLEYVAHHWSEPSFDLWEEVKGDHFYTLMAIRQALLEGSSLARRLNDANAAEHYAWQATLVENRLNDFVQDNHFVTTLNRVDGANYKYSNLDTAIILAFLHVGNQGFFRITDTRLVRSVKLLESAFNRIYPINNRGIAATALGRYPEDVYYGGNPWILTTLAAAEYNFILAHLTGKVQYIQKGDEFLERVRYHSRADGAMAEQWERNTGFQVSADELTWSHAAFITAIRERKTAKKILERKSLGQ